MTSAAELMLQRAQSLPALGPVPSPCISVCRMRMDATACEGCLRTLDEIAAWGRMDDADKRAVWRQIMERAAREAFPP